MAQNNGVIEDHWGGDGGGALWLLTWAAHVYWLGDLTAQSFFPLGLDVTSFNFTILHNHLSNHHTCIRVQMLTNHILIFCLLRWLKSPCVANVHHESQVAVKRQIDVITALAYFLSTVLGNYLELESSQTDFIYTLLLGERIKQL